MPAVATHNKYIFACPGRNGFSTYPEDINTFVSNVTFNILRDSPELVADVASGKVSRDVLEMAIIKDLDRHKYHMGLYREDMIRKVFDFMFGYGELQSYVEDEEITDIDGTRYNEFVIKRNGLRLKIPVNLGNEKIFDTYCKLIAIRNGGILNENDCHCRVTDEKYRLRINVSIRPRNISGPTISIRKHRRKSLTLDDLVEQDMINEEMHSFITNLASTDATVLFCGKGAAGKTTLLRAFVNALPEMERVLIAESDPEIYPDKPYCIEQRIKKQNEGGRPVTLRDLVRDGLTMSLDTYCIGEIVGDEALEYVKAAFTGHRALATTHSESAEDAFGRLLTLCKSANSGESEKMLKEMMAKSIDVIFYLKSFKVVDVLETQGYDAENDKFLYNRLFRFDIEGEDDMGFLKGRFIKCGKPGDRLAAKFYRKGIAVC
ncbi:MAG TPA: CpaF family protein [Clostridiaceae bacterium]|nr:CpaF family protein [Clostridiaceae bacterium]